MNSTLIWVEAHPGLASWVQAIGAIAAISVSFLFFYYQRRSEIEREKNKDLMQSMRSLQAIQRIVDWSIRVMKDGLSYQDTDRGHGAIVFQPERFDHLRELVERLIDASNHESVVNAALLTSHYLAEAKADFAACVDHELRDYFLDRMVDRIKTIELLHKALLEHQSFLEDRATKRGLIP